MKKYLVILFCGLLTSLTSCSKSDDGGGTEPEKITITVNPQTLSFEAAGGQKTLTISSSREWSAYSDATWLTLSSASGLSGSSTMTVTVAANEKYDAPRKAVINVKSGTERLTIDVSQLSPEKPAPSEIKCSLAGYDYLKWNDEFEEGTSLNTSRWTHEVQKDHWVNNELQNYVNEKSPSGKRVTEVADGCLKIHCFKEAGVIYSGRVYGNRYKGWQYGYVEARIKLPSGKGTWPAFWMMPVNFKSWPHDGEIDIMEEVGYHRDYVSSSLHADGHVHSNNTQVTKEVYCKGAEGEFHIYGMEWTKDYFQFYVDGQKTLYYKNPGTGVRDWPYDAPFYVIFNLAWGGDWGGSQGVDESALPVTMEVDWVRVFSKEP